MPRRRKHRTKPKGILGLFLIVGIVWACFSAKRDPKPAAAPALAEEAPPSLLASEAAAGPNTATSAPALAGTSEPDVPGPVKEAGPDEDSSPLEAVSAGVPEGPVDGPKRADTLLAAAENLARAGKRSAAIDFYVAVVKEYFGTKQAEAAAAGIRALGGAVPAVAESERWTPERERDRYPVVAARSTARTTARTSAPEVPRYDPPPVWPSYDGGYSGYSSDKSVHVRGYYRKNGTYVQSHYRRPPRR